MSQKEKNQGPVTIENGESKPVESNAAAPDELAALTAKAQAEQPAGEGTPGAPPSPPEVPTAAVLLMLYSPLAAIVAPNWRLQESECKALADAHALVIDKYFPDGLGAMGPEISAVLVTVAVLGVRFNRPMREPEKKPKSDDASAAQ